MERVELETPGLHGDEEAFTGSLVELILAASDTTDDHWEIADRVDAVLRSDRTEITRAD